MTENYVWQFTNQRKLNKKEFLNYFERKIFKTIRKHSMLPKDKKIKIRKSEDLNTKVLVKVLEKKLQISYSKNSNFSSENLSEIAEKIIANLLKRKFSGPSPKDKICRPLYFISDSELEQYAKLTNTKGKKRNSNKKIRELLDKFTEKNPDLEINIVKALNQLPRKD